MRFTTRIILLASLLLHLTAVSGHAELNVEGYVELTIARLELVEASWREKDEPPSEQELKELYQSHDTDREAYFCFSGENSKEIEAYLERHPEKRDAIDSLAAAIRQRIAQRSEG